MVAMPDSMSDNCRQIGESARERGLDLSDGMIRDLARLALDYDVAAQQQHSSGLEWSLLALRRVDSAVDEPARYVRAILDAWNTRGCDVYVRTETSSNAAPSPPDMEEVKLPQPTSLPQRSPNDPQTNLWQQVLDELELQMTRSTFDTWLRNTRLLELRDGSEESVWIIQVVNQYARDWLENRLFSTIQRTLVRLSNRPADVQFVVSS